MFENTCLAIMAIAAATGLIAASGAVTHWQTVIAAIN